MSICARNTPDAIEVMERAVEIARDAGVLGDVLGSGRPLRHGNAAWARAPMSAARKTSLLNSLEGKRGVVRAKTAAARA